MQPTIELFQFELCPYCHKVKAGLDLKGLVYRKVDVNPMTKKELPKLPTDAPQKVPVLSIDGEIVYDSSAILRWLDERWPERSPFISPDETRRALNDEVATWVDDELCYALPTVIYGTWGEAVKAAQVTARTSNFGFVQNLTVRAGGSLIMHQISKRILKKRSRTDGHAWIEEEFDRFEAWLGDDDHIGGELLALGDVATHGALTCVRDFPIFEKIMRRPKIRAWYDRVAARRAQSTVG